MSAEADQPIVLALPWRNFNYDFANGEFHSFGEPLILKEGEFSAAGVGANVWDAGVVLVKCLENEKLFARDAFRGKRVIELGAGVGMLGIALGLHMGADSYITDLAMVLPIIRANVLANLEILPGNPLPRATKSGGMIRVEELNWGTSVDHLSPPFDYIFGADIVYTDELMPILVDSMVRLSDDSTQIYLCHKTRSNLNNKRFFGMVAEHFDCEQVADELIEARLRIDEIHLYKLMKKRTGVFTCPK